MNHVTHLGKHPDGTVSFRAKAAVDLDGSSLGCGAGFPNQCGTSLKFDKPGSKHPRVNAEDTPFVVIPREFVLTDPKTKTKTLITSFADDTGIGQGDLAVAARTSEGKCSFGVVGGSGPHFRLGELSMRAHGDLNNPQCIEKDEYPCKAVVHDNNGHGIEDVDYIIFAGTGPKPLYSQNVNEVSGQQARERVKSFIEKYQK